jgi:hypothetical protein
MLPVVAPALLALLDSARVEVLGAFTPEASQCVTPSPETRFFLDLLPQVRNPEAHTLAMNGRSSLDATLDSVRSRRHFRGRALPADGFNRRSAVRRIAAIRAVVVVRLFWVASTHSEL